MAQIKLYKTYKELQDIKIKELEEKYLYTKWVHVFMGRNMPAHTIKEICGIYMFMNKPAVHLRNIGEDEPHCGRFLSILLDPTYWTRVE